MCAAKARASMGDVAPVLSAVGLTKRFGEVTAVSELSFELEAGTVTGFLGPNGAGKTTTLRMLLGLAAPTDGRALVFGRPFAELERPATPCRRRARVRRPAPGAHGTRSPAGPGSAARYPAPASTRCSRWSTCQAAAGRRAAGYSLGMRQRLALAAALLGDPELLILDEPANGLDPEGMRWLRDFLRALRARRAGRCSSRATTSPRSHRRSTGS